MYHYLVFETNNNLKTENIGKNTIFNIPAYINEKNWKKYNGLEYYFCKILFDVKNILFLSDIFENVNIYTTSDVYNILSKNDYTTIHYLTEELEFSFVEQYNKPKKLHNNSEIIIFYNNYKSCINSSFINNGELNRELLDFNNESYE